MRRTSLAIALLTLGCSSYGYAPARPAAATPAPAPAAVGTSLFDGRTTAGWRGYRKDSLPAGWQVVDGALTRVGPGGDIITTGTYANFELTLEWKISPGGNSGIFYRASEDTDAIYWNAPEMQVLDDSGHSDGRSRLTAAGSDYGIYPSPAGVVKRAGEWNAVRLVVNGTHVEQWLNGVKGVEYEFGSPDWTARVAAGKFAPHPHYGKNTAGHIGRHHPAPRVAFRNIQIRVLP